MASSSSPLLLPFLLLFITLLSPLPPASAFPGRPFRRSCHHPPTSFSFPDFANDLHHIALFGDAQLSSAGPDPRRPSVLVSGSQPQSVGRLFYAKPVRFLEPSRRRGSVSFSSFFSFSMSAKEGDGLAFVILPEKDFAGANGPWLGLSHEEGPHPRSVPLAHTFAVEFDSMMNKEVGDPNGNHVGLDIGSLVSVAVANVSDLAVTLNDGEHLYAWIDYHSPIQTLEVRLSKSQGQRPVSPLLSHRVDLTEVWKEEMFVGFSSSTGASPQKHMIYSWSFATTDGRMHSHPAHPRYQGTHRGQPEWHGQHPEHTGHGPHHGDTWVRRLEELWRIVVALLFGAVCGSVMAAAVVAVWSFLHGRFRTSEAEVGMHPIIFGYQQIATDGK